MRESCSVDSTHSTASTPPSQTFPLTLTLFSPGRRNFFTHAARVLSVVTDSAARCDAWDSASTHPLNPSLPGSENLHPVPAWLHDSANGQTCRSKRRTQPQLLICREDYYPALVSFAFGLCPHVGVSGERHMDDAALCRGHRLEAIFAPTGCDTPRRSASQPPQHLETTLPVVLDVDNHKRLSAQLAACDHANEELEGLKRFAASSDQQTCVLAFDLENQRTIFIVVTDVRIGNDTHCTEEVVEKFRDKLLGFLVLFPGYRWG